MSDISPDFGSPICLSHFQRVLCKNNDLCATTKSAADALVAQDDPAFNRFFPELVKHLKQCERSHSHTAHPSAVGMIIQAMAVKRDNLELHRDSCLVLAILASENADCQNDIVLKEGASILLDIMRQFDTNLKIQRGGFAVLRCLTMVELGRKALLDQGILEFLLTVLKNPLERDEIIVEDAVATAARVVFESHESKIKFGEMGIVEVMTGIMEHFEDNAMIIAGAGLALRNLAFCIGNRDRMKAGNSIDLLFGGLKRHHENGAVVYQMLAAITNTIAVDDIATTSFMVKRGYVNQMFHTLARYSSQGEHCTMIGDVLVHMCSFDQEGYRNRKDLVAGACVSDDVKGCLALVQTIENAIEVNDVVLFVKMTRLSDQLCTLEQFRREIGVAGLLDVLVKFLEGEDPLVYHVDVVLDCLVSCLSGVDANKIKFSEVHGLAVVLKVMQDKAECGTTTEKAIKVVGIAISGQNVTTRELIQGKTDIMAGVLAGMSQFSSCFLVQQGGVSTLIKIANETPKDVEAMVGMGALDQIHKTLELHKDNAVVGFLANHLLSLLIENASQHNMRCHEAGTKRRGVSVRMSRSRNVGNSARNRNSRSWSRWGRSNGRSGSRGRVDSEV